MAFADGSAGSSPAANHQEMGEWMEKIKENSFLFLFGAYGYACIEILWRGFTHWSMFLTGGFCFLTVHKFNISHHESPLWKRCLAGSGIITCTEFTVGVVVNLVMKLGVWDYSKAPFNILGQVCLLYSFLWFLLCYPITKLSDYMTSHLFHRSLRAGKQVQTVKAS